MRSTAFIVASLLAVSSAAFEAGAQTEPLAQVEALQPPVWLEREGVKYALASAALLQAGDRFSTGAGGRLHIGLADRSIVKLGESAELQLPRLELKTSGGDEGGILSGALNVLKGAFRYTTRAVGMLHARELDIRIGPTITAGIRGTDIWGQTDNAQELLCLLEGEVEVDSPGQPPQVMSKAGTFLVVPRDQAPLPVEPVPADKLLQWIPQTELKPGHAALTAIGSFLVGLESHESTEAAQAAVGKFATLGYATEVIRARVGERIWYRVVINGLPDADSARRFAAEIREPLNLKSPWVMAPANL